MSDPRASPRGADGETEVVRVEWLLPDGRGVGRIEDRSVRIRGALPGDLVRCRILGRSQGRSVDGELLDVLEPSEDRQAPPCPWDASCGGCDLAALKPDARQAALQRSATWALGRHLGHAPDLEVGWVPSPRQTAHRARIALAISGGRVGYRAARSHDLVEVGTCAAARPEVADALARLRQASLPSGLQRVEIRSDGERVVYAFTGEAAAATLAPLGDVALNGRRVTGDPRLSLTVQGVELRASPRSFYQVNLEINALLVEHVVQQVGASKAERVLDLYAGIGNLSLPIAASGVPVAAVELEGQAIGDLRARIGERPVDAVAGKVERVDFTRTPFDVAVLDPPRAGAPGVLRRLVRQRPRALIYVSCHLPSALRDLAEAPGYRITSARCFDMFPDTHHFETVLVLERE